MGGDLTKGTSWDGLVRALSSIYLGKLQRPHCDLTGIMVNNGNHPQMALIQVSWGVGRDRKKLVALNQVSEL